MLDLAIVIVNYNTCALLRECLRSVYASQGNCTFEVCVVDNASPDSSADMVRAEFPQVRLIESKHNGGYPYANNLGLRSFGFSDSPQAAVTCDLCCGQSLTEPGGGTVRRPAQAPSSGQATTILDLPRYVLLLNPDTVLPPDALAQMMAFMDAHPDAGVVGPKLVRPDGSLDLACRRSFPTPEISLWRMLGLSKLFPHTRRFGRYNVTYLDPDQLTEVDSVVGASMWVRREAIQQVGLLDETFWMYGEDLDWAKRMKDAGWKVWYNPAITVLHVKEAASRHSRRARVEFYRAMAIFYRKHYAATTPFWLHWLILAGIAVTGGLDVGQRALRGQWRQTQASRAEVTS